MTKKRYSLQECKKALRTHIDENWINRKSFAAHVGVHYQSLTRILSDNKHKPSKRMLIEMGWEEQSHYTKKEVVNEQVSI